MNKDRASYYEYSIDDGQGWWKKEVPVAESWFQQELNLLAGFSDRGQPNLRLVWAGNLLHDITERPRLKYMVVREITTGYNYVKKDGTIGITPSMSLPKDARIPWEFYPKKERVELGRLRWAVERHVPAHELKKLGRFQNRRAPDGELILRELPPEGVYDHFFWIQTARGRYREADRQVLTAIQAMWKYDVTTSEAQKTLDAIEAEQNNILIGVEQAREVWQTI